jgi:predicted O-methyltransferase YrrM
MDYRATTEVPPLVRWAMALGDELAFDISCQVEVGRLLHVLAGQVREGTIGEIGTGCGVGTAWMATALRPGVRLVTVEQNEEQAEHVSRLFADHVAVTVLPGDWRGMLPYGPFALLFADAPPKRDAPEEVIEALLPGGLLVLDDLTPEDQWPEEWKGKPDLLRTFWLNDSRVQAVEVSVSPRMNVILATRVQ